MLLAYYSSSSGNTTRFINNGDFKNTVRIVSGEEKINEDFICICPTYANGKGQGSVPDQVKDFLKMNKEYLKGVIGTGNLNFGKTYGISADIISRNYQVPVLYKFELAGTKKDIEYIYQLLEGFNE